MNPNAVFLTPGYRKLWASLGELGIFGQLVGSTPKVEVSAFPYPLKSTPETWLLQFLLGKNSYDEYTWWSGRRTALPELDLHQILTLPVDCAGSPTHLDKMSKAPAVPGEVKVITS